MALALVRSGMFSFKLLFLKKLKHVVINICSHMMVYYLKVIISLDLGKGALMSRFYFLINILSFSEYVNLSYDLKNHVEDETNIEENQQCSKRKATGISTVPAEDNKQYTELSEYYRDDKSTYDEIKRQSHLRHN
jgi:hypothetical protein